MKRFLAIIAASATLLFAACATNNENDATLEKVYERYTLNEDGSQEYNFQKVMRYNTHYSFFSLFGETFVVYNPEYQDLTINHCYTIQADGTRVDAPANAFNKVLPRDAASAPAYNHLTEMVITHTGLELGATVYLDYTITTKPEMFSSLDIDRTFSQQGAFIEDYTLEVVLPEGKELAWSLTDSNVQPTVKGNTYRWTLKNLPAGAGEQLATKHNEGLPRLTATTAASLGEALMPFTIETRDLVRVPADVVADAKCDGCKAKAVQKFVVEGLGNSAVKPEVVGYRLRQCREVLRTAYGTKAEKASAMARLMRAEGLEAEMVVVMPRNTTNSAKTITNYLVRFGEEFYSVDKAETVDVALRADRDAIYNLAGEEIAIEPKAQVVEASFEGGYADTDKKWSLNEVEGSNYSILTLADTEGVDAWHLPALNTERREMCEIPSPIEESATFTISLDGAKCKSTDKTLNIENKAGKVNISIANEDGKVTISRTISLPKSIYTAEEYADLHALLLAWKSKANREIIIEK